MKKISLFALILATLNAIAVFKDMSPLGLFLTSVMSLGLLWAAKLGQDENESAVTWMLAFGFAMFVRFGAKMALDQSLFNALMLILILGGVVLPIYMMTKDTEDRIKAIEEKINAQSK
jgi:hypothetical protein